MTVSVYSYWSVEAGRVVAEEVRVQVERVDQVELGQVDEVEAHELRSLDSDRIARVVERAPVDRVEVVAAVAVGVVAVHHHHELLRGCPWLLRIDDQRAVEPLVDVLLERGGMAVIELHAVRPRLELVGELAPGRHHLEHAVHVRRMDAVEVNRVRMRAGIDEVDAQHVPLRRPQDRARDRAVVGPGRKEHAGSDFDLGVGCGEGVFADAARLVRQRRWWIEQCVEVVRTADRRHPGADHRGMPGCCSRHRRMRAAVARMIGAGRLGRALEGIACHGRSRRERSGGGQKPSAGEMMFSHC